MAINGSKFYFFLMIRYVTIRLRSDTASTVLRKLDLKLDPTVLGHSLFPWTYLHGLIDSTFLCSKVHICKLEKVQYTQQLNIGCVFLEFFVISMFLQFLFIIGSSHASRVPQTISKIHLCWQCTAVETGFDPDSMKEIPT